MTTRRWMIAVAVVGLMLYGAYLGRLSLAYQRLAERYTEPILWAGDSDTELEARQRLSPAEWQADMERKYRRAACYPFLPVPPDPPSP